METLGVHIPKQGLNDVHLTCVVLFYYQYLVVAPIGEQCRHGGPSQGAAHDKRRINRRNATEVMGPTGAPPLLRTPGITRSSLRKGGAEAGIARIKLLEET